MGVQCLDGLFQIKQSIQPPTLHPPLPGQLWQSGSLYRGFLGLGIDLWLWIVPEMHGCGSLGTQAAVLPPNPLFSSGWLQ